MIPEPHPVDSQTAIMDPPSTDAATAVEERRECTRIAEEMTAQLIGLGCTRAVSCAIRNVSEGGLYVHAPSDSGLAVGRRYEVIVGEGPVPPLMASAMIAGCYATVVRTELFLETPERRIGAGLRFDQPLML